MSNRKKGKRKKGGSTAWNRTNGEVQIVQIAVLFFMSLEPL